MSDISTMIEAVMATTCIMLGLSHALRPKAWREFFEMLVRHGEAGAIANGLLTLPAGIVIVVGHNVWTGPGIVLTLYGYILLVKSTIIFLFPRAGIKSMSLAEEKPARMYGAAIMLLFVGGMSGYAFLR